MIKDQLLTHCIARLAGNVHASSISLLGWQCPGRPAALARWAGNVHASSISSLGWQYPRQQH